MELSGVWPQEGHRRRTSSERTLLGRADRAEAGAHRSTSRRNRELQQAMGREGTEVMGMVELASPRDRKTAEIGLSGSRSHEKACSTESAGTTCPPVPTTTPLPPAPYRPKPGSLRHPALPFRAFGKIAPAAPPFHGPYNLEQARWRSRMGIERLKAPITVEEPERVGKLGSERARKVEKVKLSIRTAIRKADLLQSRSYRNRSPSGIDDGTTGLPVPNMPADQPTAAPKMRELLARGMSWLRRVKG